MRSKEEYMELLRSYFLNKAKAYGVVKMALFGSVVRGEQTETSDVDVAYEGKADILLRCRMKQELEDLFDCRSRYYPPPRATFRHCILAKYL